MNKNTTGFTIVELLIVIVVIAILAAISIVAYTNIQQRARVSAAQNDFAGIRRSLDVYKATNSTSTYPSTNVELAAVGMRVTSSLYGPVSGAGNLVYCVNTDTDEFAFVGRLASVSTTLSVTSREGVRVSTMNTAFATVCGLVDATTENRYVVNGFGGNGPASWLMN